MLTRYTDFAFASGLRPRVTFHFPDHLGDAREIIQRTFSEIHVFEGSPESILEFDNVYLGAGAKARALYRADGTRVDESCLRRRSAEPTGFFWRADAVITPPIAATTIREPVLYQSLCINHWGHFLIESIARLWPREKYPEFATMKGAFLPFGWPEHDHPNIKEFLRLAQAQPTPSPDLASFVKLEKCFVPAATYSEGLEAYTAHSAATRRVAARYLEGRPYRRDPRPVYLSRTRLLDPNARRVFLNEEALEDALAARGFRIVYPEELTLGEQIEMFNTCSFIAGCWGSAFHGVLFSLQGAALTTCILTGPFAPGNYIMIDAAAGQDSHYLAVMRRETTSDPTVKQRALTIDIDAVLGHFSAIGIA